MIEGNFDVFDALQPDCQNLIRQIFKALQRLVKDTDHPSNISVKYLKNQYLSKFLAMRYYTQNCMPQNALCCLYNFTIIITVEYMLVTNYIGMSSKGTWKERSLHFSRALQVLQLCG